MLNIFKIINGFTDIVIDTKRIFELNHIKYQNYCQIIIKITIITTDGGLSLSLYIYIYIYNIYIYIERERERAPISIYIYIYIYIYKYIYIYIEPPYQWS